MKKFTLKKSMVLSLAILAASTTLWGQTFNDGPLKYNVTSAGEVEVSNGNKDGNTEAVTVPATVTYEGTTYTVTSVARSGFDYSRIPELTLPSTITKFGEQAFAHQQAIKSFIIPKSVTTMDPYCFAWSESLESITFEEGSAITSIEHHVFNGVKNVAEMVIPEGVTYIGDWSMERMSSMVTLTLPSSLNTLGDGCFAECTSLVALNLNAPVPPATDGRNPFINNFPVASCVLCVPDGTVDTYKETSPYSNIANIQSGEIKIEKFQVGDYTYQAIEDDKVTLIKVANGMVSAEIPATITVEGKVYNVEAIGASVFRNSPLESVKFSEGLKVIGDEAFYGCDKLKTITLPEGLEEIGARAFCDSRIEEFIIPNSVTKMGNRLFPGSTKSLVLSKNCPVIPNQACVWADLVEINIPEGVIQINYEAFVCRNNVERISLPSTLTTLGNKVFGDNVKTQSIVCAAVNAPTGGSDNTFTNEVYANATLKVPFGSLESYKNTMPWSQFANIEETKINIGNEFEYGDFRYDLIDNATAKVVKYLGSATNVEIPNAVKYNDAFVNVVEIASNAFEGTGVTSVEIAQNIKTIASKAFAGVTLTLVKAYAVEAPACAADAFTAETYAGAKLSVGAQCSESYKAAEGWKNFKNIVEVVEVGNKFTEGKFVFTVLENECVSVGLTEATIKDLTITEITVPETATYDGVTYTVVAVSEEGFMYFGCPMDFTGNENHINKCKGTITVTLPETIEEIGKKAFYDSHIKSINLPASVTTLHESCFQGSTLEGDFTIPTGVVILPANALSWTRHIKKVTLPEGLESIGVDAFMGSYLTEIVIPSTVGEIDNAFWVNVYLTKVVVNDLDAYLGLTFEHYSGSPFNCANASLYVDGEEVKEIDYRDYGHVTVGDYLFYGCSSLEKLIFSEDFEHIGYDAFTKCDNIRSIFIYNETPIAFTPTVNPYFTENVFKNATLYVPELTLAAYRSHNVWGQFKNIVEMDGEQGGIEGIGSDINGISIEDGVIANPDGLEVKIYDITGRVVATSSETVIRPAVKGLVIVKCGDKAIKARSNKAFDDFQSMI